jgi:hypothetical protein
MAANVGYSSIQLDSAKTDLVEQLVQMGFLHSYGLLAAEQVNPALPNALALCMHWMDENPLDPEQEAQETILSRLTTMGFRRTESIEALTATKHDVGRAALRLLASQANDLRGLMQDERKDLEAITPGGPEELDSFEDASLPDFSELDRMQKLLDDDASNEFNTPFDELSARSRAATEKRRRRQDADAQAAAVLDVQDSTTEAKQHSQPQVADNAKRTGSSSRSAIVAVQLKEQILQLQELVLSYQTKYLALRRRAKKMKNQAS